MHGSVRGTDEWVAGLESGLQIHWGGNLEEDEWCDHLKRKGDRR